eukprot:EG_transcript_25916
MHRCPRPQGTMLHGGFEDEAEEQQNSAPTPDMCADTVLGNTLMDLGLVSSTQPLLDHFGKCPEPYGQDLRLVKRLLEEARGLLLREVTTDYLQGPASQFVAQAVDAALKERRGVIGVLHPLPGAPGHAVRVLRVPSLDQFYVSDPLLGGLQTLPASAFSDFLVVGRKQ